MAAGAGLPAGPSSSYRVGQMMINCRINMAQVRNECATVAMPPTDAVKLANVRLMLQPEQRLVITGTGDNHVFLVANGALLLEAQVHGEQRRALELLFPGDVFATVDVPRMPGMLLIAATACDLIRYTVSPVDVSTNAEWPISAWMQTAFAHRNARRMLHYASIAEPVAEHRLGDFLVEAGLYLGHENGPSRSFELPFAREQIASYLALNPDTLSRLFTRFKQRGLIAVARRRVTVPCWSALCQASPLADAMIDLATQRAPAPGLLQVTARSLPA